MDLFESVLLGFFVVLDSVSEVYRILCLRFFKGRRGKGKRGSYLGTV